MTKQHSVSLQRGTGFRGPGFRGPGVSDQQLGQEAVHSLVNTYLQLLHLPATPRQHLLPQRQVADLHRVDRVAVANQRYSSVC